MSYRPIMHNSEGVLPPPGFRLIRASVENTAAKNRIFGWYKWLWHGEKQMGKNGTFPYRNRNNKGQDSNDWNERANYSMGCIYGMRIASVFS